MVKVNSLVTEKFFWVFFCTALDTFFGVRPKLSSLNDNELIWSDAWIPQTVAYNPWAYRSL